MPENLPAVLSSGYDELRRAVEHTLRTGHETLTRQRLETYWQVGRLINAHLHRHGLRVATTAAVAARLERDLQVPRFGRRLLYRCALFARQFPVLEPAPGLTWAHYQLLCSVADPAERARLAAQASAGGWSSPELALHLQASAPATPPRPATPALIPDTRPLAPRRGRPGTCRLVARGPSLAVDLGFRLYQPLPATASADLHAGDFVTRDSAGGWIRTTATPADLYTYPVTVHRVVDGDTLALAFHLPSGHEHDTKVRLRGLDCPESDTPEGMRAKHFTESLVQMAAAVIVTTTKPDKYDRYLSDVHLVMDSPAADTAADGLFLNNALLAQGHATRMA
jgi:endonuclease YncB( thermonuclease family)